MKMGEEHVVSLSRQAVVVLEAIEPISGGGRCVFPSLAVTDPSAQTRSISLCEAWATPAMT